MANKRYYWLKLKNDFFAQPKIKKLRKIAGGDTYTLIYLKLQLLSLQREGILIFEGIEDNFVEEMALTIDEDVENVKVTLSYLMAQGLVEEVEKDTFLLPETVDNTGSETSSTRRSRESRKNNKALQCNTYATPMQQQRNILQQICNTEKEKEIEIELDIEKDIEKELDIELDFSQSVKDELTTTKKTETTTTNNTFTPPTIKEVESYCLERKNNINSEKFIDYYTANGWLVGKNKMKDWKACLRNWEKNNKKYENEKSNSVQASYDISNTAYLYDF